MKLSSFRSGLTKILIPALLMGAAAPARLAEGIGALAGTPRYVATTGADSGNCSDPSAPCATIGYASLVASDGDTILLAVGTYTRSSPGAAAAVGIYRSLTISGGWNNSFTTQVGISTIDGQGLWPAIIVYYSSTVTVDHLLITSGYANGRSGGGIYNENGTLTINYSIISGNTDYTYYDGGGGIYNGAGSMTLNNTFVTGNVSFFHGGGVYNAGTLTMNNSTVSQNTVGMRAYGDGAGVYNAGTLILNNSTVSGNSTDLGNGGGIYTEGELTLNNSTVSGNRANYNHGGGIFNWDGTLLLSNSTVSGNTAVGVAGGIYSSGSLSVSNSTLSGNTATSGGGVVVYGGTVNLNQATISQNVAASGDQPALGGGIDVVQGSLTMRNSIIAGNVAPSGPDCDGTAVSAGHNLMGRRDGCTITQAPGDLLGTKDAPLDAKLGDLQDNGGLTLTHALLIGSPALDAGDPSTCLFTDQRGVARPQGAACDIGAFEGSIMPTPTSTPMLLTANFASSGARDGWILESGETTGAGGSMNATGATFRLGDDGQDRQYRSILSFDTSALPDGAVITKVTLRIARYSVVGTNPFTTHGNLVVDVRKGSFYNNSSLQLADFKAASSVNNVGNIPNSPTRAWYATTWPSGILGYINKTGLTQLRLRFSKDDNDDRGADYLNFYSGNAASSYRPQLIIECYVP